MVGIQKKDDTPYDTSSYIISKPQCPEFDKTYIDKNKDILDKLGQGTYGITFKACYNKGCSIKQGIKLLSIKNKYPDDETHPSNIEINIGKELTTFVNNKYTPNINKITDNYRCHINDIKDLKSFKNTEWMKETLELLDQNKIFNYVNIYFMDLASIDLAKFIKYRCNNNSIHFTETSEMLFQICHTLSVIQYLIPHYRHNDLKPNNIVVKIKNNNIDLPFNEYNDTLEYNNADKSFNIPFRSYIIKIIDFDFSYSKKYQNSKITNYKLTNFKYLGYSPFINPVFDLHFILNTFYINSYIMTHLPELKQFIEEIIPSECIGVKDNYVHRGKLTAYFSKDKHTRKKTNYIPYMFTPIELIHYTAYFKPLQKSHKKMIKESYSTPFKQITDKMRCRKDMFNLFHIKA